MNRPAIPPPPLEPEAECAPESTHAPCELAPRDLAETVRPPRPSTR